MRLGLILLLARLATKFAAEESCVDRWENGFDSKKNYQCDTMCRHYKSCCSDYETACRMKIPNHHGGHRFINKDWISIKSPVDAVLTGRLYITPRPLAAPLPPPPLPPLRDRNDGRRQPWDQQWGQYGQQYGQQGQQNGQQYGQQGLQNGQQYGQQYGHKGNNGQQYGQQYGQGQQNGQQWDQQWVRRRNRHQSYWGAGTVMDMGQALAEKGMDMGKGFTEWGMDMGKGFTERGMDMGKGFAERGMDMGKGFAERGMDMGKGFTERGMDMGKGFAERGMDMGKGFAERGMDLGRKLAEGGTCARRMTGTKTETGIEGGITRTGEEMYTTMTPDTTLRRGAYWEFVNKGQPVQSVYFFKGDKYYRVDLKTKKVDPASPPYPRSISKYCLSCPEKHLGAEKK